jgi:protein-tyrosine sulfotransferase
MELLSPQVTVRHEIAGDRLNHRNPVYIMSPMQRCGTNHLADIIMLHPDFQLPRILQEDFMFEHAQLLEQYTEKLYQRWKRLGWIDNPEECRDSMRTFLGAGMMSYVRTQVDGDRRLLLKTPDSTNIDRVLAFVPDLKLLILIRDGRDVVESAARKWPKQSYGYWMARWAMSSRAVLNFVKGKDRADQGKSWELIRYEDLVRDPEGTAREILRFIGLDESRFQWNKLNCLPVRGSSGIYDEQGKVSRQAVDKPSDFSPIGRWRNWSRWRKRRFKKVAGRELIELGYEADGAW